MRSGALHFVGGKVSPETHRKGDIFHLYDAAVEQAPAGGLPFLIFIDANVPESYPKDAPGYGSVPVNRFPWMADIRDGLNSRWNSHNGKTAETGLFVTNFAFYYGNDDDASPIGMVAAFASPKPNATLDRQIIDDLTYCLRYYSVVPRQV